MLKFFVSDINEVAENLRHLYKQDGDKWVLQVEGAVAREKLDEFRTNNTNLIKERDAIKKQYEGVDVADYQRLKGLETELETGKLKGKDAEKILEQRTAAMKAEHDKVIAERDAQLTNLNKELSRLKISDAAVAAAIEKGMRPGAKDDLIARVSNTFRLKDGKPVGFNGDTEIYGKNGELLSIPEYIEELLTKAPHLFEPSDGTGAGGGGAGGGKVKNNGAKVPNPWKNETQNLTMQGKILREDPALAVRLAAEAGKKIRVPAKA